MSLNKLLIAVIFSALFTSSLYLAQFIGKPLPPILTPSTIKTFTVTQKINTGSPPVISSELTANTGDTVLSLLSKSQTVTTKTYSFGTSVESINSLTNGTDGKYWLYSVNGQLGNVGADRFALQAGDVVEWKFEKAI